METLSLNGAWSLTGTGRDALAHSCPGALGNRIEMTVPGDIHSALHDAGLSGDPYAPGEWARYVADSTWTLEKTFGFATGKGRSRLVLNGVDTFASVWVNGSKALDCANAFRRHEADITNLLRDGENTIEIRFDSLTGKLAELREANPGVADHNLARKPRAHFGKGSSPALLPVAVTGDVFIETDEHVRVYSWNCVPRLSDHNWIMRVEVEAEACAETEIELTAEVATAKERVLVKAAPGRRTYSHTFAIPEEDVERWWPLGHPGGQHIYPFSIGFGSYSDRRMVGFREVEAAFAPDGGFGVEVNGERLFIKGMVWRTLDLLASRITPSRTIRVLQAAAMSGVNSIRVHAGGAYESEVFYDTCDRLGIMVWQDFMLSGGPHPASRGFRDELSQEARYQISRLKSHPSIILWCGGGGLLEAAGNGPRALVAMDRLSDGVLGAAARELDPGRAFVPHASADCLESSARRSDEGGITRQGSWREIAGKDPWGEEAPRFLMGLSFPSIPSLSTVKLWCGDGDFNLSSDTMTTHQGGEGAYEAITSEILTRYRFPGSTEKLAYISQVAQAEAVCARIDHMRASGGRCGGFYADRLASSFPGAGASSIDYAGKPKAVMYKLRSALAPLSTICFRRGGAVKVLAVNDTREEVEVKVSVKFSTFRGEKVKMQVFRKVLPPRSVTDVSETDLSFVKDIPGTFCYVKLSTPDVYREDLVFLDEPKRCRLEDPWLKVDVRKATGRGILCEVSCERPAFGVMLDSGDARGVFTDNFFDIRPTAQKQVVFAPEDDISPEDFAKKLKVMDLYWAAT